MCPVDHGGKRGPLRKAPQRKRPCRSRALPPIDQTPPFAGHQSGGIVMNTAVARRLALGDREDWIGKDGYQPTGLATSPEKAHG
jgi:hypothetical protein